MLLYLYSRPTGPGPRALGLAAAAVLRRTSVRFPRPILRLLSAPIALLLYVCVVVPGTLGDRFAINPLASLPLGTYRRRPLRSLWLDTFDRLGAPVEHRYTWRELDGMLRGADLEVETARDEAGWFVLARRRER